VMNVHTGGGSVAVVSNSSSEPGHPSVDESYILLELKNQTGTDVSIKIPMGKIVYRMGDREVAYEGGGIWSKYPEGSVLLSPPEFNYNGITLTFPVINISGTSSVGGKGGASLKFEKIGTARMIYPNGYYQNPIPENITKVNITIKSEYYDAWADFFRSLALVKVFENPEEKEVMITLGTPPLSTNFSYGALASKIIVLEEKSETDSYNSSKGPYSASRSGNGSIRATKKIDIKINAIVNGNALTGGEIVGKGKITGDAYAKSTGGVKYTNKFDPVDGLELGSTAKRVQSILNEYKASNNNNDSQAGGCLDGAGNTSLDGSAGGWSADTCTMSAGNYYLTKFDLGNNDHLIFDTRAGQVTIALDAAFNLSNNVNITVEGDNPVRIYLNDMIQLGNDVLINPTGRMNSSLFQIISSDSQDIYLSNNAEFCGFIWAPDARVYINNNAHVYGAIAGGEFHLMNNQWMHFDEALKDMKTDVGVGTTVMYMYVSRNDVLATLS
ncbi:MAG TPA: hypothetical protein VIO11_04305, partial [Candidatus Methanoperedens sp.]